MVSWEYGSAGMADPMGVHLLGTIKGKILRGQYIDLSLLLEVLTETEKRQAKH